MNKRKLFLQTKLSVYFNPKSFYIIDILDEFKEIRFKVLKNAINYNLQSLAKNEKVTTQLVCVWIRNYVDFININKQKF